jgi:GT2 family glycosyltransferase
MKYTYKKDEKVISFCIPSFNREEKTYALVMNILQYQSDDIDVIVLDNCSKDRTVERLSQIKDSRFQFVCNEYNIGGMPNILKVLTLANAQYAILCLDKDWVDYKRIADLVKMLKTEKGIVVGYCSLDISKESDRIVYQKGFQAVLNVAYLLKHPSGNFYKTDIYQRTLLVQQKNFTQNTNFAFLPDIINAHMALDGNALLVNIPVVSRGTLLSEEAINKSHTYTKENLFYSPEYQIQTCALCVADTETLSKC